MYIHLNNLTIRSRFCRGWDHSWWTWNWSP